MPLEQFDAVAEATRELLERRLERVQELVDVADASVNINPFLMLAMAPAYNIFSPFEAAEYTQYAKLPHGDSTAFGRFVEEKLFSIFGVTAPDEKPIGKAAVGANQYVATPDRTCIPSLVNPCGSI